MQMDSEIAGLLVAVGFLVMGFVSMPIATGFVLGALALGVIVALVLRFTPKKLTRVALGTVIILAAVGLWWEGHNPRRPRTVSPNALYVLAKQRFVYIAQDRLLVGLLVRRVRGC
jgi:hypothetical protein